MKWASTATGLVVPEHCIPPPPLTAVDLFAGAGGFSLGIIEAGFRVLCAVDNDPVAALTYLCNLGASHVDIRGVEQGDRQRLGATIEKCYRRTGIFPVSGGARNGRPLRPGWDGVPAFIFGDVRKLTGADILDACGLERGELDLVVGGPPCQGFSTAGRQNVMDPRNSLVFEFARLVCEMQPKAIAMENVPGILSMVTPEGLPVVDEIAAILVRGDYGERDAILRMLGADEGRRVVRRGRARPATAKLDPQFDLFSEAP